MSLAVTLLGLLALDGCASSSLKMPSPTSTLEPVSIAKYGKVTATLDFIRATASTPLDLIDTQAPQVGTKFFHAIAVRTDQCMAKRGFEAIAPRMDWSPHPDEEDRRYGLWSVDNATKYGVEVAPETGPREFDLLSLGVEYNKAHSACTESAKEGLKEAISFADSSNIDYRIRVHSQDLALSSSDGKKAVAAWRACMEKRGLVLDPEDGRPSPQYKAQGKESEINATVKEAHCAVDTGAVQTLYDIQARYERAYMDSQAAQIQAFTKKRDQVIHELDEAIAGR